MGALEDINRMVKSSEFKRGRLVYPKAEPATNKVQGFVRGPLIDPGKVQPQQPTSSVASVATEIPAGSKPNKYDHSEWNPGPKKYRWGYSWVCPTCGMGLPGLPPNAAPNEKKIWWSKEIPRAIELHNRLTHGRQKGKSL